LPIFVNYRAQACDLTMCSYVISLINASCGLENFKQQ